MLTLLMVITWMTIWNLIIIDFTQRVTPLSMFVNSSYIILMATYQILAAEKITIQILRRIFKYPDNITCECHKLWKVSLWYLLQVSRYISCNSSRLLKVIFFSKSIIVMTLFDITDHLTVRMCLFQSAFLNEWNHLIEM